MKMKKIFIIWIFINILLLGSLSAEISYCCEKTNSGAWCQNDVESNCNPSLRKAPTSCEATSFCRRGTCLNKEDGICMENTPERRCEEEFGFWVDAKPDAIPQCRLGCCFIGDQAAFVTKTRCRRMTGEYGIETIFRSDITSEGECIVSATPEVKGACVFEREFERTCRLLKKSKCQEMQDQIKGVEFFEGFLCSAEELDTNCAPTKKTTCVEGRDEVFFVDTCGNIANVYDSNKVENKNYWKEILDPECSIATDGSDKCGACSYYDGTTCKTFERGKDTKPLFGDYVCRNLDCKFDNETYKHGETWCISKYLGSTNEIFVKDGEIQVKEVDNIDKNLPGSRYFRLVCYNGEISIEPCADRRAEVCVQEDVPLNISGVDSLFRTAACRVNKWQDCSAQGSGEDCGDLDVRDCQWIEIKDGKPVCVPLYAPGFDFWKSEESGTDVCALGTETCVGRWEVGKFGTEEDQVSGEECYDEDKDIRDGWIQGKNKICASLGDCKSAYFDKVNYKEKEPLREIYRKLRPWFLPGVE
jgi:hypothetical protein